MSEQNKEEYKINGDMLLKKIKELIHEGNIRKITIKDREGHIIITLPLTVGVVGAMLAPALAAVGAVAALLTECTILVERAQDKDKDKND
ncbi:MAG: DUF4342 domain-containing protein [Candidatus Margulisbacteria bacterium]|nr:DUF4342 domain-containing protein [Candidatus Margulisiibacteriota bacterium]